MDKGPCAVSLIFRTLFGCSTACRANSASASRSNSPASVVAGGVNLTQRPAITWVCSGSTRNPNQFPSAAPLLVLLPQDSLKRCVVVPARPSRADDLHQSVRCRRQGRLTVEEDDRILFRGRPEVGHQRVRGMLLELGRVLTAAVFSGREGAQEMIQPLLDEVGDQLVGVPLSRFLREQAQLATERVLMTFEAFIWRRYRGAEKRVERGIPDPLEHRCGPAVHRPVRF